MKRFLVEATIVEWFVGKDEDDAIQKADNFYRSKNCETSDLQVVEVDDMYFGDDMIWE